MPLEAKPSTQPQCPQRSVPHMVEKMLMVHSTVLMLLTSSKWMKRRFIWTMVVRKCQWQLIWPSSARDTFLTMISKIRPLEIQLRMRDSWLSLVTIKVRLDFKTEETVWFENWTCHNPIILMNKISCCALEHQNDLKLK